MPDAVVYKLPRPFLDTAAAVLDLVDWDAASEPVKVTLPSGTVVRLEAVKSSYGKVTVRPATARDAVTIRRFADELAAADPVKYPPQSAEQTQLVLAARNPTPDKQD